MSRYAIGALFAALAISVTQAAGRLSDDEIAKRLMAQSIASYRGTCPCPYNVARNGSSCGRRSAYSKAGGYAPLCYRSDVTEQMIEDYRRNRSD